jgi:multicomponent Na+:H+ antiporter subunit E
VGHIISLAIILFTLWLGLSGHFNALLIGLGATATVLAVHLAHRMDILDHETHPALLTPRLVGYWIYLSWEIVKANIDVIRRILRPGRSISPQLVRLPLPQKSDLARVIYANSITLTPGTVTLRLDEDSLLVHALSREAARELASGSMAAKVPEPPGVEQP